MHSPTPAVFFYLRCPISTTLDTMVMQAPWPHMAACGRQRRAVPAEVTGGIVGLGDAKKVLAVPLTLSHRDHDLRLFRKCES